MVKKVFLITIYSVLSNLTFAQNSEAGSWYIYFGNQKLNKKINWHNEIQWRNYDFGSDLEQLLIRTGLGYDLTENNNNIMLGYGFIHSQIYNQNNSDKTQTNEHRVFQQLITKSSFGRYYLQHRYRVEERFISSEFKMRYRYFLGINIPVNKKQMEKNSVYISSYNEIFLNSHGKIFDRNRLYVALGYAITNKLKFEAGMMAQMYENRYRPQFQFVIFNNFDFYKN
jgi:hypothetical protein